MIRHDLAGLRDQLEENPALLSMRDDDDGWSLLHLALHCNTEMVQLLIDAGCPVNHQDTSGHTPLHEARNAGIAQVLLDAGASLSIQDKKGYTPLHLAALRDNPEVVMLLAPLSDLSLESNLGSTALDPFNSRLDWFISNGHSSQVQECVKMGEVSWSKDSEGKGMTRISADSVEELLNACIKVHKKDKLNIEKPSMTIEYPFLGPPQDLPELSSCLSSRCTTPCCTCRPTREDNPTVNPDNPDNPTSNFN
jgi:hypothetical protein